MLFCVIERKSALEETHPEHRAVQQESIYYVVYYFHMDMTESYGGLEFIFFCYSDRTWIKTTIQYKLLSDHHILLMGLQWVWLTKEPARGKRKK